MSSVNELVRSVVGKNSLSECSLNELENLVVQYPYFGPAQFLLAQKLKEENSPLYEKQTQKAFLYFQDHLWYDYLSRNEEINGIILRSKTEDLEQSPVTSLPVEKINRQQQSDDPPAGVAIEIAAPEASLTGSVSEQGNESQETEQETTEQIRGADAPELPKFKIEPLNVEPGALTFEPYHTVDYFASQGIRAKEEEEKPKDRFTQQLKSFTEWLKTMKKLPESEIVVAPGAKEDQKVTQLAEHSLADREIVTEAMADVWEKQGNKEKAIDVYRKLSLHNPAKSAYFAAKIEHLKHL